jgi:tRNA(Ile)-lysidine synthetase-like protein
LSNIFNMPPEQQVYLDTYTATATSTSNTFIDQAICNFFTYFKHIETTISKKIIYIAYSGGIDSTVLLHALHEYFQKNNALQNTYTLKTIHINHQINTHANNWLQHCIAISNKLNIECITHNIDKKTFQYLQKNIGIEAAARQLRYEAIENIAQNNIVLLGQHAQDQIETCLLQWQRGSGIDGLCGMPYHYTTKQKNKIPYFATQYYRPFIYTHKKQIQAYALQYNLKWIEDDSNEDVKYKRNYIRKHIMPHFSSAEQHNMLRSVHILQIQKNALDMYLNQKLQSCIHTQNILIYTQSTLLNKYYADNINITCIHDNKNNATNDSNDSNANANTNNNTNNNIFNNISKIILLNYTLFHEVYMQDYYLATLVFRYWLKKNNFNIESYAKIHDIMRQLFHNKNLNIDATASINICIPYQGKYIIAYQKFLYIINIEDVYFLNELNENHKNRVYKYKLYSDITHISYEYIHNIAQQNLCVKIDKRPTKTLKQLFQEQKIMPCLRGLPVICDVDGYVLYHPLLKL